MEYRDHPEYRAMLAACRATPADDLPRLVLADWLDERGEGERAEWLRQEVEAARSPDGRLGVVYGRQRWRALRSAGVEPFDLDGALSYTTDRGFVAEFEGPFASWCRHAPVVLPESIGLTVRLTDWPTYFYEDEGGGWQDTDDPAWLLPNAFEGHTEQDREEIAARMFAAEATNRWPGGTKWELPWECNLSTPMVDHIIITE